MIMLDADQMFASLGAIQVRSNITVDDTSSDGSHVVYHLKSQGTTIAQLARSGGEMPMTLIDVSGARPSANQTLTVTNWNMRYTINRTGTLDGSIDYRISGGSFDYLARFIYPHRRAPDVILSCPQ